MAKRGEKKVAVWKYEDKQVTLDVPVLMVNRDRYRANDEPATAFKVRLDEPEIELEDTDINRLKSAVFAEIKQKLQIDWRSVLYVEVFGQSESLFSDDGQIEGSSSAEVNLRYSRMQIAEVNSQKMSRKSQGQTQEYDSRKGRHVGPWKEYWGPASEGWPEVGATGESSRHYSANQQMNALIPDTDDNRAALEQITKGFDGLLKRLSDLLSPEKAEKTLANVSTVKMLALPSVA